MVTADLVLTVVGLVVFPLLFAVNVGYQRILSPAGDAAPSSCAPTSAAWRTSRSTARTVVKALGREGEETRRFAARRAPAARRQHRGRPRAQRVRPGARGAAHDRRAAGRRLSASQRVLSGAADARRRRPGRLPVHRDRVPGARDRLGARRAAAQRGRLGPRARGARRRPGPPPTARRALPGAGPVRLEVGALGFGYQPDRPVLRRRRPRRSSPAARSPWSGVPARASRR